VGSKVRLFEFPDSNLTVPPTPFLIFYQKGKRGGKRMTKMLFSELQ